MERDEGSLSNSRVCTGINQNWNMDDEIWLICSFQLDS